MIGTRQGGLLVLVAVIVIARSNAAAAEPEPSGTSPPDDESERPATAPESARRRAALDQALRLAEALHDEDVLLDLYARKSARRNASRSTLESLVASSEARGVPERAIAILERRLRGNADDEVSVEILAALLTRAGRAREAAATWAKLVSLRGAKGLTGEEALNYARVLSRIDEAEPAWDALAAATPPEDSARDYWVARAGLAWQLSRDADAEHSYQSAWQLGEHTVEVRQRLSALARLHGDVAALARLGKWSFAESQDPSDLIEAGLFQLETRDWKGLGETVGLLGRSSTPVGNVAGYWTLRAEWLAHLGDQFGALEAWDRALAHDSQHALGPQYLWSALGFRNKVYLARAVDRVRTLGLDDDAELREPLALALAELGRATEALRLLSHDIGDPRILAGSADTLATALRTVGRVQAAARVRARADRRVIADHRPIALDAADGRESFVRIAEAIGDLRGPEAQVRWMRAVLATAPASLSIAARADLLARLRDAEGRTEAARVLWQRASTDPAQGADARERVLQLALVDDDRPFLREAIANPRGFPNEAIIEAALRVEDSVSAHDRLESTADAPDDPERVAQMNALALLDERRAPRAAAGATFETIGAVTDYGPDAAAAFTWRDLRLGLDASARALTTPNDPRGLAPGTRESQVMAGWRSESHGGSSEMAAGVSYHTDGTLPCARVVYERWVDSRLLLTMRGALDDRIDDAPLLRALAAASYGSATARFESGPVYASLEGKVRDDRTHTFLQLGSQASEEGEAGLRVWRGRPELDVGLKAYSQQRDNVRRFPTTISQSWPDPALTPGSQLPPSYSFVALVARLAHGDLGERHALTGAPWPRYECGLETGWRLPTRQFASGGRCTLGVRVGGQGELSASALYGWGLFALSQSTSARVSVTYDQRF